MDGFLYVVQAANNVKRFASSEPVSSGQGWVAELDDGGTVEFSRRGCPACGFTLGGLDREKLMSVAVGELRKAAP